ncbi:MAG: tetratricopeptide repeat protein [Treponema sp.]|jgi:tetratricopeptide (TPR) repeat protein/CHAT domain-containing protein|nr:tetratricopeptide repeat protein [Treponema sp.]
MKKLAFAALFCLAGVLGFAQTAEEWFARGRAAQEENYAAAMEAFDAAIALNPQYAEAYNGKGTIYLAAGDPEQAIAEFSRAIAINGAYAEAYKNRADAYKRTESYDKALEDYTRLTVLDPRDAEAWFFRGTIHALWNDPDKALADYTEAIRLNPDYAEAYYNRGYIYGEQGDLDRIIADWAEVLRIRPEDSRIREGLAVAYYNRGFAYAGKGDMDAAIADWTEAIRLNPEYAEFYYNRGVAYGDKGDLDAAIADYTAAIRLNPDYAAYYNRGNAYRAKGDLDTAIADYTAAIRLNPNLAIAYSNRGVTYADKGDLDRAIADYTAALKLNPELAEAYNNRGNAYSDKDEPDLAIADFTVALTLNPEDAIAYYNRGNVYSDKGDLDQAIADFTAALKLNPNYAEAYNNRGNAYSNKGDLDAVIADLTAALKLNPELAEAYSNRGNAYSDKGEPDLAIADYTAALKLNPNFALAYNNRGNAYKDKGDLDQAIADYTATLKLNPEFALAYNNRGNVYGDKGDPDRAIADYTAALKLNPELAEAYSNRGNAYRDKGDLDLAVVDYTAALKLNPELAGAYNNRGNAYYAKGNMDLATADYRRSIEAAAQSDNMLDIFLTAWQFAGYMYEHYPFLEDVPGGYAALRTGLARDALAAGITRAEEARSGLGTRGAALTARLLYQYYAAVDLEVFAGSPDRAFLYSESLRSRGFLEQLGTGAALGLEGVDAGDARRVWELMQDTGKIQETLARLDPQTQGDRYVETARLLAGMETELAALEARILGGLSPEGKARYTQLRNPKPVTAEEARVWLADDTAVLEYVLWDDTVDFAAPASSGGQSSFRDRPSINSYCLVLTKDGVIPVRLDRGQDYLSLVNYLRHNIIEDLPEYMEERRNVLYNTLVKPVLDRLPPSVTKLIIVPDGILGHLPFDVLRPDSESPDLGQRYRLSFSPSVSVSMLAAGRTEDNLPLLALGGAWYHPEKKAGNRGERDTEPAGEEPVETPAQGTTARRWLDLPGTETEVRELQKLVSPGKITLLLGSAVSEETVKELSRTGELAGYPVLHFACHGFFDARDADRSGIVFSEVSGLIATGQDGYLTIPEIVLLRTKSRIAVLSACETGLGEVRRGDRMVGMARAFMVAGTENVGVSLWSISDEGTAEFMTRMYRKVLEEGQSFKEAYYQVKKEFRADPKWNKPVYWAAFVLYE